MKKTKITIGILAIAFLTFSAISCKDDKKEESVKDDAKTETHGNSGHDHNNTNSDAHQNSGKETVVIDTYLQLKDALVADNNDGAAKAGQALADALESFDVNNFEESQQQDLVEIIEVAKEHGEHIAKNDIGHQREHFEALSKDMADLIAITGTSKTLYQQYCPMYNNNKGGIWLSDSKEVRNPLFGSKMLKCGSVQKEIK